MTKEENEFKQREDSEMIETQLRGCDEIFLIFLKNKVIKELQRRLQNDANKG